MVKGVLPEGPESQVDTTNEGMAPGTGLHSLSSVMLAQPCFPQQIYSLELHLLAEVIKRVACFLRKSSLYSP